MRRVASIVAAGLLAVVLAGCGTGVEVASPLSSPSPSLTAAPVVTVVSVIDGDTIRTTEGTVRIIGIDAPENGVCGADPPTQRLAELLPAGAAVVLELPDGQNATDRHDRLLRYVTTDQGVDVALDLLIAGVAIARYDSTDGYPEHPREASYRAAQLATLADDGSVLTVECRAAAEAAEQERIAAEQAEAARIAAEQAEAERAAAEQADEVDRWWLQYPSCTRLKKNTAGHPTGPFHHVADAEIYDWFAHGTGNRGDGDGDGLACE